MTKKGVSFAHECLVFEVCQTQPAENVLYENTNVHAALPCRISVDASGWDSQRKAAAASRRRLQSVGVSCAL